MCFLHVFCSVSALIVHNTSYLCFHFYFLHTYSLIKSHSHTLIKPLPSLSHPLSQPHRHLPVPTLLWSSTYPPGWLTHTATGTFWPLLSDRAHLATLPVLSSDCSLADYEERAPLPPPFINPQLLHCWLGRPMWSHHVGG